MFNLFKKPKATSEELAAGFYLVVERAMSSSHPHFLTGEQKAILTLACFDKVIKKYEMDKKIMGLLVAIFVKEFYKKTEITDIGVEMLAIFDKILKLNSFWEVKQEENAEDFTRRQFGDNFPFGIKRDAAQRTLLTHFYITELKIIDDLIGDTIRKLKILAE